MDAAADSTRSDVFSVSQKKSHVELGMLSSKKSSVELGMRSSARESLLETDGRARPGEGSGLLVAEPGADDSGLAMLAWRKRIETAIRKQTRLRERQKANKKKHS